MNQTKPNDRTPLLESRQAYAHTFMHMEYTHTQISAIKFGTRSHLSMNAIPTTQFNMYKL